MLVSLVSHSIQHRLCLLTSNTAELPNPKMADRRRPAGRDYRERSPARDPQYEERLRDRGRDERSQPYDDRYGASQRGAYDRGRGDSRGRGREYSRGAYGGDQGGAITRKDTTFPSSVSSGEHLPDLPEEVPIPKDGRRLDLPLRPAEGTVGRPLTLAVNHFAIQSLPIIKVCSAVPHNAV
jgi:hypothetical protein